MTYQITATEREYLRELAKKYYNYSQLPVMEERKKLWYSHNTFQGKRPPIIIETGPFFSELLPPLTCTSPAAQNIERQLLMPIINHELIDDDKVITPDFEISWQTTLKEYNLDVGVERAEDKEGGTNGFAVDHPINNLKEDLPKLQDSVFNVNKETSIAWKNVIEEQIGDILDVKFCNNLLNWHVTPSAKVVFLMGMEAMLYAIMDYPDEFHQLMAHIEKNIMQFVKWQEKEGLLTLNNGNHYAGAGSRGFTNELPTAECKTRGHITPKDIWINMNSQETLGISPEMFGEFFFPYYKRLAEEFGLVYYGCCEPVHAIWDDYISKLPSLRKVSISAWCNEEFMGERLKHSNVIYSRKPSPNYIGVGDFDETAFADHIKTTLKAAKGCNTEIIFRDIIRIGGDKEKPGKAIQIVRNLIDELW